MGMVIKCCPREKQGQQNDTIYTTKNLLRGSKQPPQQNDTRVKYKIRFKEIKVKTK